MNPVSRKKRIISLCFSLFIIHCSLLLSCSPTESVFKDQKITLQADAGVTEVWLTLSAEPLKANAVYTVKRDTSLIFKGKLNKNDTLLYNSGLKPDENYKYTAYAEMNGERSPAISAEIVTMDTTSHDFSWTTYEFGGQGGSSAFYDVAIIDENDIWAVGEIYTKDTYTYDSLGNWIDPYNAAHWDGEKWELKRIYYKQDSSTFWRPIPSVFSFDKNDIWFGNFTHWNGKSFQSIPLNISFPSQITKMWGTSSEDLYVVGNSGLIAHCNGQSWTKIESGTDLPIQDIWGSKDERTGEYEILCVASNPHLNRGKKLLKIIDSKTVEINSEGLSWSLSGIWFIKSKKYLIVGAGVFKKNFLANNQWYFYPEGEITSYISNSIRGRGLNDIVIVGNYNDISHYNGKTWKEYRELFDEQGRLFGVNIKDNIIVGVGYKYLNGMSDPGIIYFGRR